MSAVRGAKATAVLLISVTFAALVCCSEAQSSPIVARTPYNVTGECGTLGKQCCCPPTDAGRIGCCLADDLSCYKFDIAPDPTAPSKGLCMPTKAPKGCGTEDGPCCLSNQANLYVVTCDKGLTCIAPEAFPYRSYPQHALLLEDFSKSYVDPKVMGACKKVAPCNSPLGPCGPSECPGVKMQCPKGYYCARPSDATVGDRCIKLTPRAGKPDGPCLPNNLPEAPIVELPGFGGPKAPPFCPGKDDVCFTFVGPQWLRVRSHANVFDYTKAKLYPSRIWGTQCVTVPKACGGVGQPCCPGVSDGLITDKPLPSFGKPWQGKPCDDVTTEDGSYCDGQWTALGGPLSGTCKANQKGCNDVGNKCCIRTSADKSERYCKGGGKRVYCVFTDNTCRLCPRVADTLLDFLVCT